MGRKPRSCILRRMPPAPPEEETILLVRLSAIGDVLQCLHALAALRRARPRARIHWLVEDRCAAVLRGHPDLDGVLVYERRALSREAVRPWLWPRALGRAWRLVRTLRTLRPTVAVDLQGNLKGALLARLSGAPRRLGLAAGQGGKDFSHRFATEPVGIPEAARRHRADRALSLLAPLGAGPADGAVTVGGAREAGPGVEAWLRDRGLLAGGFVVLHPGTSGYGSMKRWPPGRFAALARAVRDGHGLPVLVTAGPGEEALAERVVGESRGAARRGPETRSLADLAALLARAAAVVGADTGPVHLAALLGAPTVALFGPKDPGVYAPRGPRVRVVWKQVWCSPCRLRHCDDPVCMTELRLDEVLPEVESLLAGRAG